MLSDRSAKSTGLFCKLLQDPAGSASNMQAPRAPTLPLSGAQTARIEWMSVGLILALVRLPDSHGPLVSTAVEQPLRHH